MPKSKLTGVSHAVVSIARISGEQFEQARLLLYETVGGKKIAEIKFQANRLDVDRYAHQGEMRKPDVEADKPDHRLDFGAHPYGPHYAGKWKLEGLDATPTRSGIYLREVIARVAKIQDKIAKVVEERNLARVAGRSHCELGLWIDALEALNVPVELNRYAKRDGEPLRSFLELPEHCRNPGHQFLKAATEGRLRQDYNAWRVVSPEENAQ